MGSRAGLTILAILAVAACASTPTPPPATPTAAATGSPIISPFAASGSPSRGPSAPPSAATTWVGDPITVAEAIDHRDNHLDATELAVEGYSWRPGNVFCPLILPASPVMDHCPDDRIWLSDANPGPQTGPDFVKPAQPAIELLMRRDTYAQTPLPPQPGRVIALGHFDDHRSGDCPADQVDRCRHNFMVDAILSADDPALDRLAIDGRQIEPGTLTNVSVPGVVEDATGVTPGTDRIVVASAVPGTSISRYEPRASGIETLTAAEVVWLIRYLARTDNRPVLKTVLVAYRQGQSKGTIFSITASGEIVRQ